MLMLVYSNEIVYSKIKLKLFANDSCIRFK